MKTKIALVAGVTGIVGRGIAQFLSSLPDWQVIGCARRLPVHSSVPLPYPILAIDLTDEEKTRSTLSGMKFLTHIFFCGRADYQPGLKEPIDTNLLMLKNLIQAVEPIALGLQHVHIVQGSKVYGSDLGPYVTPALESHPRVNPTNWYYEQEDWLRERSAQSHWHWSASRPHGVCDAQIDSIRGLARVLAIYASICRSQGLPLSFPGNVGGFHSLYQCVELPLLSRAMAWISTEPSCQNEVFNVTNGDSMRWVNIWPKVAQFFDMPVGEVRPTLLTQWAKDKAPLWSQLVREHQLIPTDFEKTAVWSYGDFNFSRPYDILSSTIKLRQSGFHDCIDTPTMILDHLAHFRSQRLIP